MSPTRGATENPPPDASAALARCAPPNGLYLNPKASPLLAPPTCARKPWQCPRRDEGEARKPSADEAADTQNIMHTLCRPCSATQYLAMLVLAAPKLRS
ncbi:hypothetical protein TgHK011_009148 [Trichoderma gracile]|nr:hypothetical protein TgHK011_009148 [Trichoderma gracile]